MDIEDEENMTQEQTDALGDLARNLESANADLEEVELQFYLHKRASAGDKEAERHLRVRLEKTRIKLEQEEELIVTSPTAWYKKIGRMLLGRRRDAR